MAERVVHQPNGRYGIFSTIVDNFIFVNATPAEIEEYYVIEAIAVAKESVLRAIQKANSPRCKYLSCECLETIHNIHGPASMETAKLLINANPHLRPSDNPKPESPTT